MRPKQLSLLPSIPKLAPEHGGMLRRGKRKLVRAIDTKRLMHVVLRSSRARGEWSMLKPRNRHRVDQAVRAIARKHGQRLYRYANVGNHLHLLVRTPSRAAFRGFLREITGAISMAVTGARKSRPLPGLDRERAAQARVTSHRGFWDYLPYTRIVSWGRDLENLKLYFVKNLFESAGLLTRRMKAAGVRVIPLTGWGAAPS